MEASDELLTIAELAIGLAGFSGIAVVFRGREGLREVDRFRFIALFSTSISVLVLAFVPFGFYHAGQTGPELWKGSSAVLLVFWFSTAWLLAVRFRPDFSAADERLPIQLEVVIWGLGTLNLLLALANLIGWPMESGVLFYLVALISYLVIAAFLFAFLVIYGSNKE